ncbi:MAG: restriction endonuclease subunit S [Thermoproteota archaeon]
MQHVYSAIFSPVHSKFFLYYTLFLAIEQLKRRVHGSTMKHFRRGELRSTFIPLPRLPEQKAIAKILSTIDKAIQKTSEVIAKTERLKKGLMQTLLTRGIGHR